MSAIVNGFAAILPLLYAGNSSRLVNAHFQGDSLGRSPVDPHS